MVGKRSFLLMALLGTDHCTSGLHMRGRLPSRALGVAPSALARTCDVRMADSSDDGAGSSVPASALERLQLVGKRAVVFFVQRDEDFLCAKEIRAFADRAAAFRELDCTLVAVRPPSGANTGSAARYPSVSFVSDDDGELKAALLDRMGARRAPSRGSFVIAGNGTVCGTVSAAVEAESHAQFALRILKSWDAAVLAAEQAPSLAAEEALKKLVATQVSETVDELKADQRAEDEAARAAQTRAQQLFAAANARSLQDFYSSTLEEELAAEAVQAANRSKYAKMRKQRALSVLEIAKTSGDASAVRLAAYDVRVAAQEEIMGVEDECSMMRMQLEVMVMPINLMNQEVEKRELEAKDLARRAYSRRAQVTKGLVALQDAQERREMLASLRQWAEKEASDKRAADEYREAVEAAWGKAAEPTASAPASTDKPAAAAQPSSAEQSTLDAFQQAAQRAAQALSPAAPEVVQGFSARVVPPVVPRMLRQLMGVAEKEEREATVAEERAEKARDRAQTAEAEREVKTRLLEAREAAAERLRRGEEEEEADSNQASLEAAMLKTMAQQAIEERKSKKPKTTQDAFQEALNKGQQQQPQPSAQRKESLAAAFAAPDSVHCPPCP